jgi:hypothetical protein
VKGWSVRSTPSSGRSGRSVLASTMYTANWEAPLLCVEEEGVVCALKKADVRGPPVRGAK